MTPWKLVLFVIVGLIAYDLIVKKLVLKATASFEGDYEEGYEE